MLTIVIMLRVLVVYFGLNATLIFSFIIIIIIIMIKTDREKSRFDLNSSSLCGIPPLFICTFLCLVLS